MVRIKDILKTGNVIKVSPQDTLSHALSKLSTSHDAGFVFTDDGKYLGLVNPYYSLIKSSYPGNAKVEHCIFHPPRIHPNFPLDKVLHLMMESKIHYLPVFDNLEKFLGIVSARHLLETLQIDQRFNVIISDVITRKKRPMITVNENDLISAALHMFKEKKVSKLIVVNNDNKVKGILSYYDLIHYLVAPKEKLHSGEKEGNKLSFFNQKVKNFAKPYVLCLSKEDNMLTALKLIMEKKIGSVVIVDQEQHPIGIVTTRDFFDLMMHKEQPIKLELINKNLSDQSRQMIGNFFEGFTVLLKKIPNLSRARLLVKEEKNGNLFEVALSLFPKKGDPQVIKQEGRDLPNLLNFLKKVKKQN